MNIQYKSQRGIGLVEALIAALVFAIGIGALIRLQGTYILTGSNANARATASAMAQAKIDELRALDFAAIAAGNDTPTPASGAAFNYARSWALTDYYYDSNGTLTVCATPADCDAGQAGVQTVKQKLLTITVSWDDPDPNNDTIVISSVINSNPASSASSLEGMLIGGSGDKPVRMYTPGVQPDVVPIDISGNVLKETSKPTPDVTSGGAFTETYFEVTSYKIGGELVRSEEFLTINCSCQPNKPSNVPIHTGLSPSYQTLSTDANGHKFLEYIVGEAVSGKIVGYPTNASGQPELCTECCGDHHDATGQTVVYDPFRPQSDYTNGDHNHYKISGGNLTLAGPNDDYLEACRMKRIDGEWRVMQDWRAANLKIMPNSTLLNSSSLSGYQDYVKDYVKDYLTAIPTGSDNSTAITPGTTWAGEPNSITLTVGATEQLTARAIYMDFMDATMVSELQTAYSGAYSGDNILPLMPFYEVNVTKLANWTSQYPNFAGPGPSTHSAPTGGFSDPLLTNNAHNRGLVTANAAGTTTIGAFIEMSNTGLTDTNQIDPQDNNSFPPSYTNNNVTDDITVVVSGSGNPPPTLSISGRINVDADTNINESDVIIQPANPATGACSITSQGHGQGQTYSYNCVLTNGVTSMTVVFSNYNDQQGNTFTDNFVCPTTNSTVVDAGLLTETTSYPFTFLSGTTNIIHDIIVKNSGIC